jgi:3-deoxy-manno-octulosonate cytidylyltransferase (CMP-KDO synthetase)
MSVTMAIPARMQSTRLPRKMLLDVGGRPLLWHVVNRVSQMKRCDQLVVLTDNRLIFDEVRSWGVEVLMTDPNCRSGTHRIASAMDRLSGKWIFNVQGDEPFIDPALLDELVEVAEKTNADVVTPIFEIRHAEEIFSPNTVKVVLDRDNCALYFSRSPIPYVRDVEKDQWIERTKFWGHIGVYGYRHSTLEQFHEWPDTDLEWCESLEQLRWLASGLKVTTHRTTYVHMAVDHPEDLERVRERFRREQEASR